MKQIWKIKTKIKTNGKAKGYFKENLGASFILGFIVLLISSLDLPGMDAIAYFALITWGALQLVCFSRFGKMNDGEAI